MKKILFILTFCVTWACNDFLEIYPETTLNDGTFYQTQDEYILLANGVYAQMRVFYKDRAWNISGIRADNYTRQFHVQPEWEKSVAVFDDFRYLSSTETILDVWRNMYRGIYNCNKLLFEIDREGVAWPDESIRDRSAGEAYFMRALSYYHLVMQFAGVPVVLEPIAAQEAEDVKRSTEDQVFDAIVSDLQAAKSHFASARDVEENGRANWGAATAMLGKVYLTTQRYSEAEAEFNSVIATGRYELLPDFADLWNPAAKDYTETIFAIQFVDAISGTLSNPLIYREAPWTSGSDVTGVPQANIRNAGSGWFWPTDALLNSFEPGDLRFGISIGWWEGPDWNDEVRIIPYGFKYKPPLNIEKGRPGDNIPVIRYADVLLMMAEVLNEQGRTGEAIPYVQQVRDRAGLTDPITQNDQTSLRDLIVKERRTELCFEFHRWYDLRRTGKAFEVMVAHGAYENATRDWLPVDAYQIEEFKMLLPIPVEELVVNQLQQNPGW